MQPKTGEQLLLLEQLGRHAPPKGGGRHSVSRSKAGESYGAHVPDLPGCVSVGETEEEALALIRDAIELHLELHLVDLRRRGEPIPALSSTAREVELAAA